MSRSSPEGPHSSRTNIVGIIGIAMMVLTVSVILFVAWGSAHTLLDPSAIPPPLSYQVVPFPTLRDSFKPGDVVEVSVARCNSQTTAIDYEVARSLINAETKEEIVLSSERTTIQPGCSTVTSRLTTLPEDVHPGTYYITYMANSSSPRWTKPVAGETVTFEVTAP